jgi:predicted peroxiredoxin
VEDNPIYIDHETEEECMEAFKELQNFIDHIIDTGIAASPSSESVRQVQHVESKSVFEFEIRQAWIESDLHMMSLV